jgi:hypothetical protein
MMTSGETQAMDTDVADGHTRARAPQTRVCLSRHPGRDALARAARHACAAWILIAATGCAQDPKPKSDTLSATAPTNPADPAVLSTRTPARIISVEPWTFGREDGKVYRTDSYRLYTTESGSVLVGRLPTFMEQALDTYTTSMGVLPRPPIPLDTYLMANRPQWTRLTQSLMGHQAEM